MYPRNHTPHDAAQGASQECGEARQTDGFRPVALPALAAAVHIRAEAERAARSRLAARRSVPIVHEDEPNA